MKLLRRMQVGDREAVAEFVTDYGSRILRRVRGKLSAQMRRIFDSQDILSTLCRHLDFYVREKKIVAGSEGEFWSLVLRMADNAVLTKVKVFHRLNRTSDEDGPLAQELLRRLNAAEDSQQGAEIEIERVIKRFPDQLDRQILTHWLNGLTHVRIADLTGLTPEAVRKRWCAIRDKLRAELQAEFV